MYTTEQIISLNEDIAKFPHVFPITEGMVTTRSGVGRMVMLDRYSQKDMALKTLKPGDLVILTVKDDPKFPMRGVGYIEKVNKKQKKATIRLEEPVAGISDGNGCVDRPLDRIEKPLELYYEQIAKRNALALAAPESDEKKAEAIKCFEEILSNELLVPAGRVLYGAGSDSMQTWFNCYVMPYPADSREGLAEHRKEVMEIMSRGGGVGTNGSTLRPKNALTRGVNGKSSGSVSWLNDLSQLTNLVSQGGSRRGAQMIMLADWHPDVIEFIISKMQNPDILRYIIASVDDPHIKEMAEQKLSFTPLTDAEKEIFELALKHHVSDELKELAEKRLHDGGHYSVHDPEFLSGANISVALTKEFMKAVDANEEYELCFPDVENYSKRDMKAYNEKWRDCGDVREWKSMGYGVKVHRTIPARQLWQLVNICATYSAEPGIFFIDNSNDMTNASAYGQKVVSTNPCGEQPLAPYSVCNLAAINLEKMATFGSGLNETLLRETVKKAIRLQDNIIDTTPYFLEKNKVQAKGERRIGLGVMGLADLLIKLGQRYGSKESLQTVDRVFEIMAVSAYEESIELAKKKGSFPFLIGETEEETLTLRKRFTESGYMQKMPAHIREGVLKYGIRNSHLLTVAPTGSTGTMVGCSTGLEPYFAFSYYRSGRLGENIVVNAPIVEDYYQATGADRGSALPDCFVSSMGLTPEEHVAVQCTIQRWVDSSLSKTVNAPKGYTVDQVQEIYESLHKGGAKGGTVYVDGSRSAQVLSLIEEEEETHDQEKEVVYGGEVGDTCPICREGEVIESAGCSTCSSCGSQLKCGL